MKLRHQNCTLPGLRVSMRGSIGLGKKSDPGKKKKKKENRTWVLGETWGNWPVLRGWLADLVTH